VGQLRIAKNHANSRHFRITLFTTRNNTTLRFPSWLELSHAHTLARTHTHTPSSSHPLRTMPQRLKAGDTPPPLRLPNAAGVEVDVPFGKGRKVL
jgi:hypothetical protein